MVLRRSVIDRVGAFDARFGAHWEDVDLSWRIRLAGFKVVRIPQAIVFHKGSQSMRRFLKRPDVAWYVRKNRLRGLIKNYGCARALWVIPGVVILYMCMSLKELVFEGNPRLAASAWRALWWNIRMCGDSLRQRKWVQRKIRKVTDRQIVLNMRRAGVCAREGV